MTDNAKHVLLQQRIIINKTTYDTEMMHLETGDAWDTDFEITEKMLNLDSAATPRLLLTLHMYH